MSEPLVNDNIYYFNDEQRYNYVEDKRTKDMQNEATFNNAKPVDTKVKREKASKYHGR